MHFQQLARTILAIFNISRHWRYSRKYVKLGLIKNSPNKLGEFFINLPLTIMPLANVFLL